MLRYYAHRFAAVEIDATYYRIPSPKTFATMARNTPVGFRFTAKLPGSLTHPSTTLRSAQDDTIDDARYFRESIEPLVEAGKFACALMQFPNGFHSKPESIDHIRRLREALPDLPLVAEFRNREWQTNETLELLAGLEIGWCNVDEPQFKTLLRPSGDVTSPIAYVRFHGRSAATWWKHEHAHERYDYLYSSEELEPWAGRVADIAANKSVREIYAFFNNHRRGQAPRNAEQFEALLRALDPSFDFARSASSAQDDNGDGEQLPLI